MTENLRLAVSTCLNREMDLQESLWVPAMAQGRLTASYCTHTNLPPPLELEALMTRSPKHCIGNQKVLASGQTWMGSATTGGIYALRDFAMQLVELSSSYVAVFGSNYIFV